MKKFCKYVWLAVIVLLSSGCAVSPTSFLNSNSTISRDETSLYRFVLIEAVLFFISIIGALSWILIRDRSRGEAKTLPPQIYGKLAWALIPVFAIILVDGGDFFEMAKTMHNVAIPFASSTDINLHVIGHRWWWEYDYTDLGIKTANELHIPVGANVQITLDSVDVIHSFWIPQLSGKTDVIPGQTNHMWITSDHEGIFTGQCAEFCGTEHAMMRIVVVVQSQKDFDTWVVNQQKPATQPQTVAEQAGYKSLTSTCASCHSLNPGETETKIAPNLTHLFSRSVFVGATYDLNEENLRKWLKNQQEMKPGAGMNITLLPEEIDGIVAYLKLLK
jgi:cytochrome c oxidase subunit II